MNSKKVAIITGASKGIGRSTALKFAANNYNVTIVGRNHEELEQLRAEIEQENRQEVLVCVGDLSNEEFLKQIIEDTVQKWGRIDVLINNAAWRTIETMRNILLENWEKTIQVCLTAPAFLAKYAAAVMEEKKIAGVIVNISSVMFQRAGGTSPAYTLIDFPEKDSITLPNKCPFFIWSPTFTSGTNIPSAGEGILPCK